MIPIPASHPQSCTRCDGTGWQPADPIYETVNGRTHRYDTVEPCTHHWRDDEYGYVRILAADDPRAMAAQTAGYLEGQHELYDISGGQYGARREGAA